MTRIKEIKLTVILDNGKFMTTSISPETYSDMMINYNLSALDESYNTLINEIQKEILNFEY